MLCVVFSSMLITYVTGLYGFLGKTPDSPGSEQSDGLRG